MDVKTAKQLLREEVWDRLEKSGVAVFPLPSHGRIPNFVGSEKAADKVRFLREWKVAGVAFANPDFAQQKIRENALLAGKVLVMASPKLKHNCVVVDPKEVKGLEHLASTIRGAFKYGKTVSFQEIPKPDLIIEGSVAVDMNGHRLGKGGGYGDVEIRTLEKLFGFIPIVTTVHDMQVFETVPFEETDEKVSIIVTPTKVIRVANVSKIMH
jgi:5-formyltetrahydrofolate cyclo-ligase